MKVPGGSCRCVTVSALLGVVFGVAGVALAEVTLVRDGLAGATLVVPDRATAAEQFAAERLQFYLVEMSGVRLPLAKESEATPGGGMVYVGRTLAAAGVLAELAARNAVAETAVIRAETPSVIVAGRDDAGTTHAVYFLLAELGCRWYFPARWGWVIPKSRTVTVAAGERVQAPDFAIRSGIGNPRARTEADPEWPVNEWARANHLGGWRWWGAGHSYQYLVDFGQFKEHPEWFAYHNGARHPTQLCTTNAEVRRLALQKVLAVLAEPDAPELICISPCDGHGFCECAECSRLIPDGGKAREDSIDRIVEFANAIADSIRDQYPGHYVTYYCDYHSLGTPRLVTPAKNTVFWITQWAQDQLHPVRADTRMGQSLANWSKYGNPLFLYTYWGSYGSFTYWPGATMLAADIPAFRARGALGVYSETHQNWGGQHLNFVLFPRLLWDSKTDVAAAVAEFCAKAFGPAAGALGDYYRMLEEVTAAGPPQYHLHSEIMTLFTPSVMGRLRACLDAARGALGEPGVDPDCRQRLEFVEAGCRLAEVYYSIHALSKQFGQSKDPATRAQVNEGYRVLLEFINRPGLKDRLIENWLFEPGLRQEAEAAAHGASFAPGTFAYEDGFERGGKTPLDALSVSGFQEGVWGLDLQVGATGTVLYEFAAREGAFAAVRVTQFITGNHGRKFLRVSTVSATGPWQDAYAQRAPPGEAEPAIGAPVELTPLVEGKPRFWLQITLTNELAPHAVCGLDLMKLEGEVK